MPGLLDLASFMTPPQQPQQPPGAAPPPANPQAQMPPQGGGTQMSPQVLQMILAKLAGGGMPAGGAPAPQPGPMGAPMGSPPPLTGNSDPGRSGGPLPGSMGGPVDQMGAAAGQMPQPQFLETISRMAALRKSQNPDPTDPGFVRSMKSLRDRGVISQEKFDTMINNPNQYASGQ